MFEDVTLKRYAYVHRSGERTVSERIARAEIVSRWEAAKGGFKFIGVPADPKTARLIKKNGHPKNQEIYFETRDILLGGMS